METNNEYKVVEILSPRQIILHCGSDDGISSNQIFLVFGYGPIIKDPDTGEELERLEIPRGRGRVVHLQKKICTVESTAVEETPITITRKSPLGNVFSFSGPSEETQIRRDKLPFYEVQIGDIARKIK